MSNINPTTMASAIKLAYERRLLTRAIPRYVHGRWAMKARITKFGSWEVRRYGSMGAMTTPLASGTTPAQQTAPTITPLTMTPTFYGSWLGFTDDVELMAFDPILSELSSVLGEQCGLSADTLVRDELIASSTIDYTGGVTANAQLDSPQHDISYIDIVRQYAQLEADSALPVDGEDYILVLHPHSYASLMLDPTWVNLFIQEAPNSPLRSAYVGRLLRMKIFVSANVREWVDAGVGGTTDVYAALFIGRESYGILGLTGAEEPKDVDGQGTDGRPLTGKQIRPVDIITKQVGSSGTADPLDQRGTLAWKMCLSQRVLNITWIRSLRHTNVFSDT